MREIMDSLPKDVQIRGLWHLIEILQAQKKALKDEIKTLTETEKPSTL